MKLYYYEYYGKRPSIEYHSLGSYVSITIVRLDGFILETPFGFNLWEGNTSDRVYQNLEKIKQEVAQRGGYELELVELE